MITGKVKSLKELFQIISPYKRIGLVGCKTCMTVCGVGGEQQVLEAMTGLSIMLKSADVKKSLDHIMIDRQCLDSGLLKSSFSDLIQNKWDAVLSFGCAAGVQQIAQVFSDKAVLPAVDTQFIGAEFEPGIFSECCIGCGHCRIHLTSGICVLARCPKHMQNGPCGGESNKGMCEVTPTEPCVWIEFEQRLSSMLADDQILPAQPWQHSQSGGIRRIRTRKRLSHD